ncbi:hypothetical protein Ocin01_17185 [Orchesella cincta]|uniref:Uncharacterized protein n=1 Tax=Orchesella cincta TaxID=48709 RepID=A0A1D2M935_ORCCI|nr:hypothetical protein Ocin01_17185 [Orchesella cincta]
MRRKSQSHQTTEDGISEDAFIGEVPIETNPVDTFATQSSQELVDTVRSSITDLQCNPISPACYLFNDLGLEYKKSIESLTTTREVSPYMLSLCSDRVRNFHVLAKELAASNDLVQRNIGYAIRNLNCTDSENFGQIENSFWFQIIYKSVQVWDFHSLPKHLKTHFRSVNEKSMEWIEKLEKTFGQFAQQVNGFKEEFLEYHDTLEINQGVRTCIWRKPNRNRLSEYGLKQEGDELCSTTSFQSASSSQPIFLNFTDFDMDLVQVNPDESRNILLSFNKSSSNIQIALVAILFSHIDEVCSRALVNLNSALKIHERQLQLKGLKQLIPTDKRLSTFRQLHQLENLVLAVTVEVIHEKLRETIDCIGKVDNAISQFNRLFQMVQLQLEDRGIIDTTVKKTSTRRRSKRELQMKKEHQDHDFYLNETIQLLRHSVDAMPNSFEIRDESHKNAYLQWVKLAEKDTRLVETFNNNPHISGSESAINSSELKDGMDSKIGAFAESSQIDLDETLYASFDYELFRYC